MEDCSNYSSARGRRPPLRNAKVVDSIPTALNGATKEEGYKGFDSSCENIRFLRGLRQVSRRGGSGGGRFGTNPTRVRLEYLPW